MLVLSSPVGPDRRPSRRPRAGFTSAAARDAGFALHHRTRAERGTARVWGQSEIAERLDDTVSAWESWSELHQAYEGPWRDLVHHSGRVLQALSFQPTGAICAAATTSLPETVGGTRNWDYRYAWVRDASFTIEALWVAACPDEANEFFEYMTTSAAGSLEPGRRPADHVRHRRRTRPHRTGAAPPAGWRDSRPGAGRQRCLEPAPARRLRRVARAPSTGSPTISSTGVPTGWTDGRPRQVGSPPTWLQPPDGSSSNWPTLRPGAGRRRTRASGRSGASPATSCTPKLMCWVALDRAVALADRARRLRPSRRVETDEERDPRGDPDQGLERPRQRLHASPSAPTTSTPPT